MTRKKPRFLVALDFSPPSAAALRQARALAQAAGASLTLAHVRPFSNVRAAVVEERGDLLRGKVRFLSSALREHFQALLRSAARESGARRVKLLCGDPARELCREARKGYDLIVIGTRGRGPVTAALLGSTAQKTIRGAAVPVLVVSGRSLATRKSRSNRG
jgi:nucleotide-binding universal stress UspA family protein